MELGRALGTGTKCLLWRQKSHFAEIQKFRLAMLIIALIIKLLKPLQCWGLVCFGVCCLVFLVDSYLQVSGVLDILNEIQNLSQSSKFVVHSSIPIFTILIFTRILFLPLNMFLELM